MNRTFLFFILLLCGGFLQAQNYQAINGSMYAGSLAQSANPAAIVHVPYAWDITPFAIQLKQSSNAYQIQNYSFLSPPGKAAAAAAGIFSAADFGGVDKPGHQTCAPHGQARDLSCASPIERLARCEPAILSR